MARRGCGQQKEKAVMCDSQRKTAEKGGAWAWALLGRLQPWNVESAPAGSLLELRVSYTFFILLL